MELSRLVIATILLEDVMVDPDAVKWDMERYQ